MNGTTEVNKTVEANSKKTISSILKESEAVIKIIRVKTKKPLSKSKLFLNFLENTYCGKQEKSRYGQRLPFNTD